MEPRNINTPQQSQARSIEVPSIEMPVAPVEDGARVGSSPEKLQKNHEVYQDRPASTEVAPQVPQVSQPAQLPSVNTSPVVNDPADPGVNPASAADEDLIEQEWVKRAKTILEETKDNPYEKERQIGLLHADYVKKRYGRVIGEVTE